MPFHRMASMIRFSAWTAVLLIGAGGQGCANMGPEGLVISTEVLESTASVNDPARVRVTAANVGLTRVTWGPGSSSCQLWLQVRTGNGGAFAPVDGRVCTADLVTPALEPGESRTETLSWSGRAQVGDSIVVLEPGVYQLRGLALPASVSALVLVTLVEGA